MQDVLLGASDEADSTPIRNEAAAAAVDVSGEQRYRIQFTPHSEMLQKANEPLLLVKQLRKLGGLTIEADVSKLPLLDALDPEAAYIGWTFVLETGAPQSAVHEVFEFVEDDCDLKIEMLGNSVGKSAEPPASAAPGARSQ